MSAKMLLMNVLIYLSK